MLGCEGASERGYGRWLGILADEIDLHIHIDADVLGHGGGDPNTLVNRAVARLHDEAKRGRSYWVRAILLDKDLFGQDPARDRHALALAEQHDIVLVWQKYEHEGFLLRHIEGCERLRPPVGQSEQILRRHWPNYRKPLSGREIRATLSHDSLTRARLVEPDLNRLLRALGWPEQPP